MSAKDLPTCDWIQQGIDDKNLQNLKPLFQTALPGDPAHYFLLSSVDIKHSLGKTPCDLENPKTSTCFLVAIGTVPDPTGETWDTYFLACPHGPPCDTFLQLFGFV